VPHGGKPCDHQPVRASKDRHRARGAAWARTLLWAPGRGGCNRSTCNRRRQLAPSASHHKFLNGGEIGETVTVTLTMADTLKNIKHDTISFKCIAP